MRLAPYKHSTLKYKKQDRESLWPTAKNPAPLRLLLLPPEDASSHITPKTHQNPTFAAPLHSPNCHGKFTHRAMLARGTFSIMGKLSEISSDQPRRESKERNRKKQRVYLWHSNSYYAENQTNVHIQKFPCALLPISRFNYIRQAVTKRTSLNTFEPDVPSDSLRCSPSKLRNSWKKLLPLRTLPACWMKLWTAIQHKKFRPFKHGHKRSPRALPLGLI